MRMSNEEVMRELRSDSPLNRARAAFSSACGRIEQEGQQRNPIGPIAIRAMEFEAVCKIIEAAGYEVPPKRSAEGEETITRADVMDQTAEARRQMMMEANNGRI